MQYVVDANELKMTGSDIRSAQVRLVMEFKETSSLEQRNIIKESLENWLQSEIDLNLVEEQKISVEEGSTIVSICIFVAKGLTGGALAAVGGLLFRFLRRRIQNHLRLQGKEVPVDVAGEMLVSSSVPITPSIAKINESEQSYMAAYGLNELSKPSLDALFPLALSTSKDVKITFEFEDQDVTDKFEAQLSNGKLKSIIRTQVFND